MRKKPWSWRTIHLDISVQGDEGACFSKNYKSLNGCRSCKDAACRAGGRTVEVLTRRIRYSQYELNQTGTEELRKEIRRSVEYCSSCAVEKVDLVIL